MTHLRKVQTLAEALRDDSDAPLPGFNTSPPALRNLDESDLPEEAAPSTKRSLGRSSRLFRRTKRPSLSGGAAAFFTMFSPNSTTVAAGTISSIGTSGKSSITTTAAPQQHRKNQFSLTSALDRVSSSPQPRSRLTTRATGGTDILSVEEIVKAEGKETDRPSSLASGTTDRSSRTSSGSSSGLEGIESQSHASQTGSGGISSEAWNQQHTQPLSQQSNWRTELLTPEAFAAPNRGDRARQARVRRSYHLLSAAARSQAGTSLSSSLLTEEEEGGGEEKIRLGAISPFSEGDHTLLAGQDPTMEIKLEINESQTALSPPRRQSRYVGRAQAQRQRRASLSDLQRELQVQAQSASWTPHDLYTLATIAADGVKTDGDSQAGIQITSPAFHMPFQGGLTPRPCGSRIFRQQQQRLRQAQGRTPEEVHGQEEEEDEEEDNSLFVGECHVDTE